MREHKFRKGRMLMLLLSVAMVLTMVPGLLMMGAEKVSATVEDTDVAKIGDTGYATIENALTAWSEGGGTLTLLKDVEYNATAAYSVSKTQVLDLNGKTFAWNTSSANGIEIVKDGKLTIKDTAESKGALNFNNTSTTSGKGILSGGKGITGCELVVDGANISQTSTKTTYLFYISSGSFTLKDTNISVAGKTSYPIYVYSYTDNLTVNVKNVKVTGSVVTYGITFSGYTSSTNTVDAEIDGFEIDATGSTSYLTGIYATYKNATVVIKNANIDATKTSNSTSKAVYVSSGTVTIKNGTYKGNQYSVQRYGGNVYIEGGTFENSVTASAGGISGGKFKVEPLGSSATDGKYFAKNGDYYELEEVNPDTAPVVLTYDGDTGTVTKYYMDPVSALAMNSGKTNAVATVRYDCESAGFSSYYIEKVVINEGVTLTCSSSITLSSGGVKTSRYTLVNNGTLKVKSISAGAGLGGLQNNGNIDCESISNTSSSWENNGTITFTSSSSSTIGATFVNNGTLKASVNGAILNVNTSVKNSNGDILLTPSGYVWNGSTWVMDGKIAIVRNNEVVGKFNNFTNAVKYTENGDTLRMDADCSTMTMTVSNKTLTLDLNGHTLSYGNNVAGGAVLKVDSGGILTVKDSTISTEAKISDGELDYTGGKVQASYGVPAVLVKSGGQFVLESGTLEARSSNNAIALSSNASQSSPDYGVENAVATINGGAVVNTNALTDRYGDAIYIMGTGSSKNYQDSNPTINIKGGVVLSNRGNAIMGQGTCNNTKINISGGTVQSKEMFAIYHPQYGELNVSGGTIKGNDGIAIKGGDLTITGGTLIGTGSDYTPDEGGSSGVYGVGAAVQLDDNYAREVKINISGGTLTSEKASALKIYCTGTNKNSRAIITGGLFKGGNSKAAVFTTTASSVVLEDNISGGHFSTEPNADYIAPGCEVIDDTPAYVEKGYYYTIGVPVAKITQGETTKKYLTLADAIAAVKDGETITMLADVSAAGGISVPSGKNFTVDFDGHTYKAEKPGAGSAGTKTQAFQLLKDSNITFKNGTIACTDANASFTWDTSDKTAEKGVAMIIQNYADLTLDNMVIDGTNIAHNGNNVRYVMSNNCGTVTIKDTTITAASGDFAFDSCKYSTYAKPTVNVTGTSVINGKVELTGGDVNLESGSKVNGMVRVGENKEGTSVKDSVLNIKSGATVANSQYAIVVFGKNEVNIAGTVAGSMATNGNAYNAGSVINVNEGASITADAYDVAIYMPNGALNVTGGTISGDTAVYFKSTKINISGGTFIADGDKKDYNYNGNGGDATGDALVIDSCNYPNGIDEVSITDGYFKSANNHAVAAFTSQGGEAVKNFISGGHFSDKPDADYIVSDKTAYDDTDANKAKGYNWIVGVRQFYITASSALTNNHSATVAAITGGGMYAGGVQVTLTAPEVTGLTFEGWCKGEVSDTYVSEEKAYRFNASEDAIYIAVYAPTEPGQEVDITGKTEGAAKAAGKVQIDDSEPASQDTKQAEVGDTVTLTATVDKTVTEPVTEREPRFVCWQNSDGAVLGTGTTYTCTAVQAETVEALYLYEGAAIVQFNNDAGEFIQSKVVIESKSSDVTTVVLDSKRGQDFVCWLDDNGAKMNDAQVKAAIQEASKTRDGAGFGVVNVTAKFEDPQQYTVTIHMYNVDESREIGIATTITKNVGEAIKYTADLQNVTKDMSFIGYSTDKTEAKIFCTSNVLTLNPDKAEEFEYWILYENNTVEPEVPATVTLGKPYDASTNVHKMGFTMSWALPEGATFIEAGFFDATSKDALDAMAAGDVDKTSLTGSTGSFTLIFNREGKEDVDLYLRAYVKYSLGGNTYYVINGEGGTINSTPIKTTSLTTVDVSGLDYVKACFNDLSK